jgi:hypothetical protein
VRLSIGDHGVPVDNLDAHVEVDARACGGDGLGRRAGIFGLARN